MEREHERDEFQQEIKNLEAQLKMPSKGHTGGDTKGRRVSSTTPSKTVRMSRCWRVKCFSSRFQDNAAFFKFLFVFC